jgi:hypothetical protein
MSVEMWSSIQKPGKELQSWPGCLMMKKAPELNPACLMLSCGANPADTGLGRVP